ncbi:MAG: carboxypeptidase-like regulatory domain-containing protein, partial [Terriglobales bacterium]
MRVPRTECLPVRLHLSSTINLAAILGFALSAWGQGSYRAQLRGVVSDATGAVVANATVTIRDVGTNISSSAHTDDKG